MLIRITELYLGFAIVLWLGISIILTVIASSEFMFMELPTRSDPLKKFTRSQGYFRRRLLASWVWPIAIWSPAGRKTLKKAWKGL